ncbi:MAG: DUF1304 domain-containing protein [Patulibacter minatonensis]
MPIASLIFATLAALLHVFFWVLESLRWRQPATWKRFGAKSQEDADAIAPMAFNQGFYNLFLAAGTLIGVVFSISSRGGHGDTITGSFSGGFSADQSAPDGGASAFVQGLSAFRDHYIGNSLIWFGLTCMLGAAIVLVLSNRKLARAAAIQGTFPALALLIALAF